MTYREYLDNPELRSRLIAQAHRDRVREMDRLIFAPLAALLRRLAKPEARKPSAVFPAVRGC